jgi:hypothetical protein
LCQSQARCGSRAEHRTARTHVARYNVNLKDETRPMPEAEDIPAPPSPFYAPLAKLPAVEPDTAQVPHALPSESPATGPGGAVSSPARQAGKSPAKAKSSPAKSPPGTKPTAAKCPFCGLQPHVCTCGGNSTAAAGAAPELSPSKAKQRTATPPAHASTPAAADPPASSPPSAGAKRKLLGATDPSPHEAAAAPADDDKEIVFHTVKASPPKRQAVAPPPPPQQQQQRQADVPNVRGVVSTLGGRVMSPLKPAAVAVAAARNGGDASAPGASGSHTLDFRIAVEAVDEQGGEYLGFYLSPQDMQELGIRTEKVSTWIKNRQRRGTGGAAGQGAHGNGRNGGALAAPQALGAHKGAAGHARAPAAPRPAPAAPAPAAPAAAVSGAKWSAALTRVFEMCFPGTKDECKLEDVTYALTLGGIYGEEQQAFLDHYEGTAILVDPLHRMVHKTV